MTDADSDAEWTATEATTGADSTVVPDSESDRQVCDGVVSLTWRTRAVEDADEPATLVALRVRNDAAVPQRIRLRSRLDGPLAPPRRRGVPEVGWSGREFTGDVPAEATLALGYACLAPDDGHSPVSLTALGPAAAVDDAPATPASVVQALGDARPPAAALPSPDGLADMVRTSDPHPDAPSEASQNTGSAPASPPIPTAVDAWLRDVTERLDAATELEEASVAAATATLAAHGGIDGLVATLDADAAALRVVAERLEVVRARAETTELPLEALQGLA